MYLNLGYKNSGSKTTGPDCRSIRKGTQPKTEVNMWPVTWRTIVITASIVVALLTTGIAFGETYWVAAAAHVSGTNGTQWRTDLSILNPCEFDVSVVIRLHAEDGVYSQAFEIPSGRQQIFEDVVAELVSGEASGALEIESSAEITVTSRTYTRAANGTYGQALDGVVADQGFSPGDTIFLQQLREDGSFRTNIGVLNAGPHPAVATVELLDHTGSVVGDFRLTIGSGESVQDNRPYRERFQRTDVVGGYARVDILYGVGVFPYASVVDNGSGDPTTIGPKPETLCRLDVAVQLAAIEGMTVHEIQTNLPTYRAFRLEYLQPDDHAEPEGRRFPQSMTLLHRAFEAPMVLNTRGYSGTYSSPLEITGALEANQLSVEHRFHGASTPASGDWSLLTIEQAAADHHRIVEALKPIYGGAWINTGHSKGGMTAVYHRRFYPDDVDATVAYVSPNSLGAPDDRYLDFLANVGTPQCNQDLWAIQREALTRRDAMLALLAAEPGLTFDRIGGIERAFESIVIELPFTFWQYAGLSYCPSIPPTSAGDQTIFRFIDDFVGWDYSSDVIFEFFESYYYQAHTQLGYPAVSRDHIADLLLTDAPDSEEGVPPPGVSTTFDPTVMQDIAQWIASEGERLMFIYGEFDPWTGGAFDLGSATDSYLFVDPVGTHGAVIGSLEADDQAVAFDAIARWAEVVAPRPVPEPIHQLHPPWRRQLPDAE